MDRNAIDLPAVDALECECQEFMTRGVFTVNADAPAEDVAHVLAEHDIRAVLVVPADEGEPLGWVRDIDLATPAAPESSAADLVGERLTVISPEASMRAANYALALSGVTHLAVRRREDRLPIGVITARDAGVPARRPEKE